MKLKKKKENITIDDIAKYAGVSKTTISRYLNGKYEYMSNDTKKRIRDIILKYDYKPSNIARSLKTKNTKLIAFVVSDIENNFAAPTIKSMNEALLNTGYHMIVASSNNLVEQEKELIESLIEQRVDAILLNPVSYEADYIKEISKKLPIILIDRAIKDANLDIVASASDSSMQEGMEHLKRSGFSDLYLFTENYQEVQTRLKRVDSFKRMLDYFMFSKEFIEKSVKVIEPRNYINIEKHIINIIESTTNGIPAIICTNGRTLLSTALCIKKLKIRMPYQLGLMGYDDFGVNTALGWTEVTQTTITTLAPNWYELGKKAIDLVLKRIENPKGCKKNIKTNIKLIIKESTKLL